MVMVLVAEKRDPPSAEARSRGAGLKALRVRMGMTQGDVAEAIDRSFKTVSAYETGRAELGAEDFEKWAAALGVSVAELTTALGLGLPPETGCLGRDLSALFGPDDGVDVEQLVRDLAGLDEADRRQMIRTIQDQVAGHHVRNRRPD